MAATSPNHPIYLDKYLSLFWRGGLYVTVKAANEHEERRCGQNWKYAVLQSTRERIKSAS